MAAFEGVSAASAQSAVLAAYGAMAQLYSDWVLDRPLTQGLFEEFVAALAELRGRDGVQVLDVASASGEPAATLACALGPAATVHATDLAPEMVALATARCARLGLPNVVCRLADAKALPYADATFDAATCCMGLMFVPHTDAALAEFARVVKPGGLLAVAVFQGMAHQPFYSFLGQLAAAIDPAGAAGQPEGAADLQPLSPCRFADPAPLLAAAAAAGLPGALCRELRLSYWLAAHEWWEALCGMPDTPVKPALERAQARAATAAERGSMEAAAQQLAARILRERGWLQPDGSVLAPDNCAWFITARKGSKA